MRLLITGKGGKAGSWAIRAVQMADAIDGAEAVPHASDDAIAWADVVVLVKRAPADLVARIHAAGKPLVYDAVDFWPQPADTRRIRTVQQARDAYRAHFERIAPHGVIAATHQMAADLMPMLETLPQRPWLTTIAHHWMPGLVAVEPTEPASLVAYEGRIQTLGRWRSAIEQACADLGLSFVASPMPVPGADIAVAVRDDDHDGWLTRRWKSGVKGANALARGVPLVALPEAGYLETVPAASLVPVRRPKDIAKALREALAIRRDAYAAGIERRPHLSLKRCATSLVCLCEKVRQAAEGQSPPAPAHRAA